MYQHQMAPIQVETESMCFKNKQYFSVNLDYIAYMYIYICRLNILFFNLNQQFKNCMIIMLVCNIKV